jgi:hypothetical protein
MAFKQRRNVNSKEMEAGRQGQGKNRLTLTPSVIPNYDYIITVND